MSAETFPKKSRRAILVLLAALVFVVAGALAFRLTFLAREWLHPRVAHALAVDPDCDLARQDCSLKLPSGGRVRVSILPRGIPVATPLQVSVEVQGVVVRGVEIDFAGVDMDMGYNHFALVKDGPGEFSGQAMLPVCVRARMRWRASVLLEADGGRISAPFEFDTVR